MRALASARNVKVQYPGGVSETYKPDRTMMCTSYTTTAVDPLKQVITTLVGPETLQSVTSVAVDANGNVYILDTVQYCIFRLDPTTGFTSVFAGTQGVQGNFGDGGNATSATFVIPKSIAVNAAGDVFVCDAGFNRIRRISAGYGIITAYAGTGFQGYTGDGGAALSATFNSPAGISFDPYGNLLIADTGNNCIRKVDVATGGITTVAGNGLRGLTGDCDTATIAELNQPVGVVGDSAGNLYIADTGNSLLRTVNTNKVISSLAGQTSSGVGIPYGISGYSGDGDFSVYSTLNSPTQLALDSVGNLFFSDTGNNVIRKIQATTKIITTYAGSSVGTYGGDGAVLSVASFNAPTAIAIGPDGSWYIADSGNIRVRKASSGLQSVYAPPWFAPIAYRVLREAYNPITKSVLTYCDCPDFATYEPTYELIPPNNCFGRIVIFGGTATNYYSDNDDMFGGTATGPAPTYWVPPTNAHGAIIPSGRFGTTVFFGGDATHYLG